MPIKPAVCSAVAVVAGALVVASSTPAAAEPGPSTNAIRAQFDLITSSDRVPGALAEVRDSHGRSVTVTSGTAELGTDRPMVDGTGRFRIASNTKPFVAVAVLRLVARHRVRLDTPVETYLPGVLRGTGDGHDIDGRAITVRQLLQHTSGLPDYTNFVNPAELTHPVAPAELVRIALAHKPDFDPGQNWRYSNTGYIVAGMIVSRLMHEDIGAAVTDLVLRPADLRDTYWPRSGDRTIRGPHAQNYAVNSAGALVDVTDFEPSLAGASGAMISTPPDLNRFWQRLFDGRLLPPWALAELRTTVLAPDLGPDISYGLGVGRIPLSCGHAWAHQGGLITGGIVNLSGRADSGRTATVYITSLTGSAAAEHLFRAFDAALCSQR